MNNIRERIPQWAAYLIIAPLVIGISLLVLTFPIPATALGLSGLAARLFMGSPV